ncbi:MAG TPA: hypothetical protein VGF86_10570 [Candidatus Tumulicola sp.]|jgi:hypothetical protein
MPHGDRRAVTSKVAPTYRSISSRARPAISRRAERLRATLAAVSFAVSGPIATPEVMMRSLLASAARAYGAGDQTL